MIILPHRFRPPRKEDEKAWQVVEFLIRNGFPYQRVYEDIVKGDFKGLKKNTSYPENLRDAKEFVEKYKDQAILS